MLVISIIMCTFVVMKCSSEQHNEAQYNPFLYCECLELYLEENLAKDDASRNYFRISISVFIESHKNSYLKDYKELFEVAFADSRLIELCNKVYFEEGKKIDLVYLLLLCIYVNELIRDHYIVLLKQPTNQAIDSLSEISEITFKDKKGNAVTTKNPELIKAIMSVIETPIRTVGQSIETAKIGKIDKMSDVVATSVLQCKFAYYLAAFFNKYYPESQIKHRGKKGMVSPSEQELILRLMTLFGLANKDSYLKSVYFRKLIEFYQKLNYPSLDAELSFLEFMPITIIKYEDWKDNIDWFDLNFKLSPLSEDDKICFVKDSLIQ